MLRQYCFCPRIPYFYIVREIRPYEQIWVKQGSDEHVRQEMLMRRRNLSRFNIHGCGVIKHNVELQSDKLNLHGICDAILETGNETCVLEFKNSANFKVTTGTKVQLAAYAMLYEERARKEISRGFVLYGTKAKTYEITINSELKAKVLEIRDRISDTIRQCYIPSSAASEKKCSQCEFMNFCADRF